MKRIALVVVVIIAAVAAAPAQTTAAGRARAAADAAAAEAANATWYRSNSEGERLAEIQRRAAPDMRYALSVLERANSVEETLYRNGTPVERRVLERDGSLRYAERYSYYADGKVQEVARRYPDGRVVRSRYEFIRDRLTAEWHETADETRLVRYDQRGRIEREERWVDEQLVETVRYEYGGPEDRQPNRSVTIEPAGTGGAGSGSGSSGRGDTSGSGGAAGNTAAAASADAAAGNTSGTSSAEGGGSGSADSGSGAGGADVVETVRIYDRAGRVVERRTLRGDRVVTRVERTYGEHGVLREERISGGTSQATEYEYDGEGKVVLRTEFRGGTVTERVRFREENRRVRELYRNGELVLRVYLRGEQRVREEVIRDGTVVEERQFVEDES